MKKQYTRYLMLFILLSMILVGCGENFNNIKSNEQWIDLNRCKVSQQIDLERYSLLNKTISYANKYTVTYRFESPRTWDWCYITVEYKTNKIISIRNMYAKH